VTQAVDVATLVRASGLPRHEAERLAAAALEVRREWLIAHDRDPLEDNARLAVAALLAWRQAGMPLAMILGEREFHGHALRVTRDVLIPRADTEVLVDRAIEIAAGASPLGKDLRILDLGTGSGAIAVSLAHALPQAQVVAVDRSVHALAVARHNAGRLGVTVDLRAGDWYAPVAGERFDLIVSNPPYIAAADPHLAQGDLPFEPIGALVGGADGLDDLRVIIGGAAAHLVHGGAVLLEHGHDQGQAARDLLAAAGFEAVCTHRDLAGHERVGEGRARGPH
jgi:release factor glutamine methyltransferase